MIKLGYLGILDLEFEGPREPMCNDDFATEFDMSIATDAFRARPDKTWPHDGSSEAIDDDRWIGQLCAPIKTFFDWGVSSGHEV